MREKKRVPACGGAALPASATVEAAGIMSVVLLTVMVLMNQAFRLRAETVGNFVLHETVERERHLVEHSDKTTISRYAKGSGWSLEITASVFRPEDSLRMWSLVEDIE